MVGYQPNVDTQMLQQPFAVARIFSSYQLHRLQRFNGTGADITQIANRRGNQV
jgi:hypothetical protein